MKISRPGTFVLNPDGSCIFSGWLIQVEPGDQVVRGSQEARDAAEALVRQHIASQLVAAVGSPGEAFPIEVERLACAAIGKARQPTEPSPKRTTLRNIADIFRRSTRRR
jgi:hypothetical protein